MKSYQQFFAELKRRKVFQAAWWYGIVAFGVNASAHVALGSVLRDRREWEEADLEYRRALTLDPDNAEGYLQYAEMLSGTGRSAEAVPLIQRGVALDPAPIRRGLLGWTLILDDRAGEALPVLERAVAVGGGRLPIFEAALLNVLIGLGRLDGAERVARAGSDSAHATRVVGAVRSGDPAAMPGLLTAEQWMWFDEPDRAMQSLLDQRDDLTGIDVYRIWLPILDPIRDRPEMAELLRDVNLEGRTVQRTPRAALAPVTGFAP